MASQKLCMIEVESNSRSPPGLASRINVKVVIIVTSDHPGSVKNPKHFVDSSSSLNPATSLHPEPCMDHGSYEQS